MTEDRSDAVDFIRLSRQVRLLMLLDAAEGAGIAPIELRALHTFAFLSNVLAPVWNTQVFDGRLLKRRGGPFYPALQRDLDRLVGLGMASITNLGHLLDEEGRWRLSGAFSLNRELSADALDVMDALPQQRRLRSFLQEVAYAMSALSDSELDRLPEEDPTYSDNTVSYGNVVDFGDWRSLNYSANAARHFSTFAQQATQGELLHLYVRHLHRRLSGER